MQDVYVRRPSGIEAFFIDLDACGCNMTFHFYLELDRKPDLHILNETMRTMLETHSGMNMKFYRDAWYTSSYIPECSVVDIQGEDLEDYSPNRIDFRRHTVGLSVLHATLSDVWYLCFDFFHGVADGLSGVQFVYNFFDVLNERQLPAVAFTVSDCALVQDSSKPDWKGNRADFTVLAQCEPMDWSTNKDGKHVTTIIRSNNVIKYTAARFSKIIANYFGQKSAKMLIPINVRGHADDSNGDKTMFGNLFVPLFVDAKTCESWMDIHNRIINFVKQKPLLLSVAKSIRIYREFPTKLRQWVIKRAIPIVMSSKKFIYCALVSSLGKIDSAKLRCDLFNVRDCTATFKTFPFTAFAVVTLQFEDRTSTCVSWHNGRVPDDIAKRLVCDLTECFSSKLPALET